MAMKKWVKDVSDIDGDQWTEALESVCGCSLNVTQSINCILYYGFTAACLNCLLSVPTHCVKDAVEIMGTLYILWRCLKFLHYWTDLVLTINRIFQLAIQLGPKPCPLGILDEVIPDVREAVFRVPF